MSPKRGYSQHREGKFTQRLQLHRWRHSLTKMLISNSLNSFSISTANVSHGLASFNKFGSWIPPNFQWKLDRKLRHSLTAFNRKHLRFSSVMYSCNLLSKHRTEIECRILFPIYSSVYSLLNSLGTYGTLVNASFGAADEIASWYEAVQSPWNALEMANSITSD